MGVSFELARKIFVRSRSLVGNYLMEGSVVTSSQRNGFSNGQSSRKDHGLDAARAGGGVLSHGVGCRAWCHTAPFAPPRETLFRFPS